MRIQVTHPGHRPYACTMPVEDIGILIRDGCLVVPIDRDTREYARYREVVGGFRRDSAPSCEALYRGRLEHYERR